MKRGAFPILAALVLAFGAGLAVPVMADVPGPVYDPNGSQYVVQVNGSGTPQPAGSSVNMYADNGSGTPVAVQAGDVNNAASASGDLKSLAVCRYNATLPTLTDTRYNACQVGSRGSLNSQVIDANGTNALNVNGSGADAVSTGNNGLYAIANNYGFNGTTWDRARTSSVGTGLLVAAPPDYSYVHISAGQATTTVKSGAGSLHMICFNSAAAATNVTTIYDNTAASGTVIAIPTVTGLTFLSCEQYDLKFGTGLTINTATANGSDMTVVYR